MVDSTLLLNKILISPSTSIKETIKIIDENSMQIALVITEDSKLLGTITDGDIRRGILKGLSLDSPVDQIMNPNPTTASPHEDKGKIMQMMRLKKLRHIPIINRNGYLVDLKVLDELLDPLKKDNWVILMAGGLGSRLRPLTNHCPKPLLKVGNKPILETIIERFMEYGFYKFFLSVNYKSDMIKKYFGDGSERGIEISYLEEVTKMGTAGALSLLPETPSKPILVMNGDLLTTVNYQSLLNFHLEHHSDATMCVRQYDYQIPYGVVNVDKHRFVDMQEKPVHSFFVNAGIYVLNPSILELVPKNSYFDMPSLFSQLKSKQFGTSVFPIREYWLDVGQKDDFDRANDEFQEVFG